MKSKWFFLLVGTVLAILASGWIVAKDGPLRRTDDANATKLSEEKAAADDKERDPDRVAIQKSAQAFVQAFNKGNAKAVAAFWTSRGEYFEDSGIEIRGQEAIEKAYEQLFKDQPNAQIEVEIQSIHFPSRDTAIEEGTIRVKPPGAELPVTTRYSAMHVREDGQWKTAVSREWGAASDKLEDIGWLIGQWKAGSKEHDVQMNFAWNESKTLILSHFATKEDGRLISSGTQTIGLDPLTGRLRSWTFEDEGGRGETLWSRDGNRWLLEAWSILPNGIQTAAVNVITRLNDDAFTWQSIERIVNGEELPNTEPVKVSRVKTTK